MKCTITSKGQITIPVKIRRRLNLKPGHVLEFDEKAAYIKATRVFDSSEMYNVIGCCRKATRQAGEQWLNETRGRVEFLTEEDAHRD